MSLRSGNLSWKIWVSEVHGLRPLLAQKNPGAFCKNHIVRVEKRERGKINRTPERFIIGFNPAPQQLTKNVGEVGLTLVGKPDLAGDQSANFEKAEPFKFLAP